MLNEPQLLLTIGSELADLYDEEDVPVGNHAIKGTISLAFEGGVTRAPNIMAAPTVNLPLPLVLAMLAGAGVQASIIAETLVKAAAKAAKEKKPVGEQIDVWTGAIADARAMLKLPKVPKNGATKHILTLSQIHVDGSGLSLVKGGLQGKKAKRKSA